MANVSLGDMVGDTFEDDFFKFDLTEIQEILEALKTSSAIDLAHAEQLQQQTLRGADILSEYLGKIIKVSSYLEGKANSLKNKISLEYKSPDGKTTAEMKKSAGESAPEVEDLLIKLAKVKGSKVVLEKKYDILIKCHHHFKEIAAGMRRTIPGYAGNDKSNNWE